MNPWLDRRVLAYAHQGGAKEGPSSTLAAIRAAVAAGATAVELDVHATSDRELVVCHDPTVDRTCEANGAIAAMTLAEVRRLDNAFWWVPGSVVDHESEESAYVHRGRAPEDTDYAIATVDEVLQEFPGVFLNFDIKQTVPTVEPYEDLLAEKIRVHRRTDDVIVASFLDQATERFSELAPEIATSMGTQATAEFYRAVKAGESPTATNHVALQVPHSYGDITIVDQRFVDAAHTHGLAVHVWTIDEADEMAELVDLGVDGIITDVPSLLVPLLASRNLTYAGPHG